MERQKILNPLTGRMVYADGVVAKSIPKMKKSVGVLEGAIQRKTTTKIGEKKEAVGKLSGAIKRTLAKKPEPENPEPENPEPKKLYGWEDLPDDIKAKIGGIVKKQKSRFSMNKYIKDFLYGTGLKNPYNKLTDDELYDVLYKSDDLKKYVETNYIKKVINKMPDMGGQVIKKKIKYEYLEKFIKDDIGGENKRFVEHYRNYSNNRWFSYILKERGIMGDTARYVFLDMDKYMFWRVNLIIDDDKDTGWRAKRTEDRNIQGRLEDDDIVPIRYSRTWGELVNDAGDGLVKQDLVNGRLVYNWERHYYMMNKRNEKK